MVTPATSRRSCRRPYSTRAADAGVLQVAAFVVCFLVAFIGSHHADEHAEADDALAPNAPPKKKKKERASPTKIGWLTTDMRVPLPTLEELFENGCHLLNTLDGERFFLARRRRSPVKATASCPTTSSRAYYNAPSAKASRDA